MRLGGCDVAVDVIYTAWHEESFVHGKNTMRGTRIVAGLEM
jgi:hypothetical protein